MRTESVPARQRLTRLFDSALAPLDRAVVTFPELVPARPLSPTPAEVMSLVDQKMAVRTLGLAAQQGISLPDGATQLLRRARTVYALATLRADASWRAAQPVLTGLPFEAVVLKGPAIASRYADPRARPYTDLDLLVPTSGFRQALTRFRTAGWTTDDASVAHRWFWRFCREGVNLVSPSGDRIDLHHHVPPWNWGRALTHDALVARATSFDLAGVPALLASPEDNLLIAALHLVSDRSAPGRSLTVWRDVIELSRHVDPGRLQTVAAAAGLGGWLTAVADGLSEGLIPPATTAAGLDGLPAERRLSLLLNAPLLSRRPSLEWVARLPPPNAVALLLGQLVPSKEFRQQQADGDDRLLTYLRRRLGRPS